VVGTIREIPRDELEKLVKATAQIVWEKMTVNERQMVRIGMFPAHLMKEHDSFASPKLAVAIMEIAKNNGGMIA
jgi:hypothetical protein